MPTDKKNTSMNDLVSIIATNNSLPRKTVEPIVRETFEQIVASLKNGKEVRIAGFGAFLASERKARTGRNPRTGEEIKIPSSKRVSLKAAKFLKDAVNEK